MRKIYRTIDDVLRSPWGAIKHQDEKAAATDRVLRSTKLEDSIYADLRNDDPDLDQIEQAAAGKLTSFPALTRDIYQSFYSLMPRAGRMPMRCPQRHGGLTRRSWTTFSKTRIIPPSRQSARAGSCPPMRRPLSLPLRLPTNWTGCSPGLAGRRARSTRWKSWRLRKKRRKRSLPHCWSGCARAKSLTRRWNGGRGGRQHRRRKAAAGGGRREEN